MMVNTRIATAADIDGVLALQLLNLAVNLTEEERKAGFVTTPFTVSLIEKIIKQDGLFIAEDAEKSVVAYAFAGTWAFFSQWEIFQLMEARLPQLKFNGQLITTSNSFQYGPVCIAKAFRGRGVLNLLFEEMRLHWVAAFPISMTFINAVNVVSERAHVDKLGWEIVDRFQFNGGNYLGLAFSMERSVIK